MSKKLKVGFDLDGVILYNPARLIRPVMSLLKRKHVVKRPELEFYVPKTKQEKLLWYFFHKSSIFPAKGIDDIKALVETGKIEAYIITGRFASLRKDYNKWLKKIGAEKTFKASYLNDHDEQPHLFKERMIKELGLDVFIEDNADIVNYLISKCSATKIYWIYNFFDKKLDFTYKYPSLYQAVQQLTKLKKKS